LKKIYFFFLLLLAQLSKAQEFNYTVTKEFAIKNDDMGSIIRVNDNFIRYEVDYGPMQLAYTAKLNKVKYGINLYRYDNDMKAVQTLSLDDKQKDLGPFIPSFFTFGGKLHVLYYQYTNDNTIKLFLTQVNPADLSITKKVEIFSFDQKNVGVFKIDNAISANHVYVSASPDKKSVLVAHGNSSAITTCIIDDQLNITHNSVVEIPALTRFSIVSLFLDNNNNKYFSYNYMENKENRRGILTDDNKGNTKFLEFKTGQPDYSANNLQFAGTKDNKVYIYANYYGDYLNEGLLLTTIDTATFQISNARLFPYPDDYKQRISKMDFGEKVKGKYSIRKVDYEFRELENGTLTFAGVPSYTVVSSGMKSTRFDDYAGPVMTVFISPDYKANFSMIPRSQKGTAASAVMLATYNNNLVCVYADKEKNINSAMDDDPSTTKDAEDLVLGVAVFDSKGNIVRRTKIADKPGGNNYFITALSQKMTDKAFLIPIGRMRVNMVKYYFEFQKLAGVEITEN